MSKKFSRIVGMAARARACVRAPDNGSAGHSGSSRLAGRGADVIGPLNMAVSSAAALTNGVLDFMGSVAHAQGVEGLLRCIAPQPSSAPAPSTLIDGSGDIRSIDLVRSQLEDRVRASLEAAAQVAQAKQDAAVAIARAGEMAKARADADARAEAHTLARIEAAVATARLEERTAGRCCALQ
jgi:hypothetical protein